VVAGGSDQDRLVHRVQEGADLLVLADGAGGVAGGREAAEELIRSAQAGLSERDECVAELARLDRLLQHNSSCGETTGVLLVIRDGRFFGASVGDSGAWAVHREAAFELTENQHRKPLLGSGVARPVGFGPHYLNDRLLVASDGLHKYVPFTRIKPLALLDPLERALDELVAAARLPSGALHDDLAIVLVQPG
jgi:serine/threonine protein phosphatase PrpC